MTSDADRRAQRCVGCGHPRGWHDISREVCTTLVTVDRLSQSCPCAVFRDGSALRR